MLANFSARCCDDQTDVYEVYGLQRKLMSPDEYLAKLMNYTEEDKHINYIGVQLF